MTRNPIYDYPDPYANPRSGALASPRKISLVGRLRLTQPVWLQLGINSATALHVLQREPPGTFLVRRSNTRQCHVLCLRLPDKSSPAFVTTYCLRQEPTVISLEGSELTFPSLLHLIASYCSTSDILPLPLRLPRPIWEASSCQHLEAIAHLGLEFWNSSLNSKGLFRPAPLVPLPSADMDPPLGAPTAAQEQSCKELSCEKPTRICGLPNPSFAEVPHRDVGVRRQYFKNSIKVRVSTEAASPLSPPAAPPPPIPVGKKKNLPLLLQSPAPGAGGQPASQNLPRVPSQAMDSYHTPCSKRMVKEKNSLGPLGAPLTPVSASGQMLCVTEEEQPGVFDKAADPGHSPRNIEEGRLGNGRDGSGFFCLCAGNLLSELVHSNTQQAHVPSLPYTWEGKAGAFLAPESESSPRLEMHRFWQEHSRNSSLQEMMLDSGAQRLTQEEMPEILTLLPCLEGQNVLELGAGIGRFTGSLAELARHVIAVDFMESFLKRNRQENGHRPNVEFLQADVTSLQLPGQSFDLIFSNWLFMYLSDEELRDLVQRMLSWLRPGGHLFFRESCFHQSGDSPRAFNPTLYRTPAEYNRLLTSAHKNVGGERYGFEIVMSRSVQTYIKRKQNRNQVCWLLQKVPRNSEAMQGYDTFQRFLDSEQYATRSIRRYEWVFGPGFVSTGGVNTTKELVSMLRLKPGQRVLDVGCGLGGGDFYMAQEFGVDVLGMDLSHNMVELALERAHKEAWSQVQFEVGDATRRTFPEGTFDVVYSRDTLLHVVDKRALLGRVLSWLKPGGQLLISDYCCGPRPWSEAFTKYVKQRGYSLLTPQEYGQVLQKAGFTQIQALDHTERMLAASTQELQDLERSRERFVQDFSEDEFESLAAQWQEKLQRCADGDQRWGVFYAVKPQ